SRCRARGHARPVGGRPCRPLDARAGWSALRSHCRGAGVIGRGGEGQGPSGAHQTERIVQLKGGRSMNITRDVINDLWPVYAAGEASADTRLLVEEFLRQNPEVAGLLQG